MTGRGPRVAAPIVAAAAVATLLGGGLEAARTARDAVGAATSIGFVAWAALPLGLVLGGLGRALAAGWGDLAIARTPTGGAPRLAAWSIWIALALGALGLAVLRGGEAIAARAKAAGVIALGTSVVAVAVALGLVALTWPAVRGLAAALAALDRWVHARLGRAPTAPVALALGGAALAAGLISLAYRGAIRPRIADTNLAPLLYPAAWAIGLVAVHLGWAAAGRWPRARRGVALGALGLALAAAGWAGVVATRVPARALDVWHDAPIAGAIVDRALDPMTMHARLVRTDLAPVARPGAAHPDVVLITIDTVRADRTPPYGGGATMANLAALAARGVVFERAIAPSNVTRRSLPTLVTSFDPPRVRGRVKGWTLELDPRHVTFAERLRAAGYRTAGFFCDETILGLRFGLSRGLDHLVFDKRSPKLGAAAATWWARQGAPGSRPPLFLWIHLFDPHGTLAGPKQEQQYRQRLAAADQALDPLLAALGPGAIVAYTSDHGESLGEHGVPNHAGSLYLSETRVPMVVAGPGLAAGRVAGVVGLLDLGPTLLDLAGYAPPDGLDGASFAPALRGEVAWPADAGRAFGFQLSDRSNREEQRAAFDGRLHLVVGKGGKVELFDHVADPAELADLAAARPADRDRLRALLDARRRAGERDPF